jgi:hypothetical protein
MVQYNFSVINFSLALNQALSSHTAAVFPACPANIHLCFMDMKYYKTTAWNPHTEVHPSNEPLLSQCPYNYQIYARTTFQFLLRIWRNAKNHDKNENSIHSFNYLINF